jgi:hypothetical protein
MQHDTTLDEAAPWFHGSPLALTELLAGSTIAQDRALARVFSHKPALVSVDERGIRRHNGRRPGFLYRIAEPVGPADLTPVPGSTMGPGQEWLIARPLRVTLIERTTPIPEEQLSPREEEELRRRLQPPGAPSPAE